MVAREPITKESRASLVETMTNKIIGIRNDSKDPKSALRRDVPMILETLYNEVKKRADPGISVEGLVVEVLTKAYKNTGDWEFERLRRQVVEKVFIKEY